MQTIELVIYVIMSFWDCTDDYTFIPVFPKSLLPLSGGTIVVVVWIHGSETEENIIWAILSADLIRKGFEELL